MEEDKIKIAELAHRNFVDIMWQKFGLASHPGYSEIKIVPLLYSAGGVVSYDPPSFCLSDLLENPEEIKYSTYHETSHLLHPLSRELHNKDVELPKEDLLLCEIVSQLATITYTIDEKKKSIQELENYYDNKPPYSYLLALDLFENNKSILSKIFKLHMNEAKEIISPNLRRPLDLNKDPYDRD